jgi:hypothetical protein
MTMSSSELGLRFRVFSVPRRGHEVGECQDACASAPETGRFAIADGAAESAYSGLWAQMLVDEFVHAGDTLAPWPGWIASVQQRWSAAIRQPVGSEPLPWYLEDRYQQGAFSTFLGMTIAESRWQAIAVGDSCLVHLRENELRDVFPLNHSSQFDNTPWLIGSRSPTDEVPLRHGLRGQGECWAGDVLLLMTDALARWFLVENETGCRPWHELALLFDQPDSAFVEWVGALRTRRLLRNDDTTLVAIWL